MSIYSKRYEEFDFNEIGSLLQRKTPEPSSSNLNNYLMNIFGSNIKKEKKDYRYSDIFFSDIYHYYENFGLYNIVLKEILEILSLIFGLFLILFIFSMIDWESILKCRDNNPENCGDIFLYINFRFPNLFIVSLLIIGSFFVLTRMAIFISNLKYLKYIHRYYESTLKIKQINSWKDIIKEVSKDSGISVENITNIIMKKDNYYTALINNHIISINPNFYTKQLDFIVRHIIFNNLEKLDSSYLRKQFIIYGFLNLILSPFIFIYLCMYLFVSYVDEFYYNTEIIGTRRYSLYAKCKFRQ